MSYKKIYIDHFGYTQADWIKCEVPECGNEAVNIHHIQHGADGRKNNIENLIALCSIHHYKAHSSTTLLSRNYFQDIHDANLERI